MTVLRLHTSSAGLDPGALVAGRDLVLHLHPVHGDDAPAGVYVLDHLDAAGRRAADQASLGTLADWRARFDGPLTVEGICWPFIWQLPVFRILNGAVADAIGLRQAVRDVAPEVIEVADTDPDTLLLARAVGRDLGLEVRVAPDAAAPGELAPPPPPPSRAQRLRRSVIGHVSALGFPSVLRRGSVAIHAYWPLMPLLDRMLAEPGHRPALFLDKRPTGVGRSLGLARKGGWIGTPTEADRRWARPRARALVEAVRADGRVDADGIELGEWLHPRLVRLAEQRAERDLATLRMLRRTLRRGRLRWIVGAYDVDPDARLIVVAAQEAGVRTLMLCHGAYVLPQPFADLDVCDEVALWSHDVAPDITNWDRPIHVVGYPLPVGDPPPTRPRPADRPVRISVLGQGTVPTTSVLDDRITMRSYVVAIEAIARRFPDAEVVLRPNPRQDSSAFAYLQQRFPDVRLVQRSGGDIVEVHSDVDLTIGGASTSTFQAALAGTPAILLNLTGTAWPYPLGGEATAVPVARSAAELDAALAAWADDGVLGGRDDLLQALGVDGGDAVQRLLGILDGRPPAPGGPARGASGARGEHENALADAVSR